MKERVLRNAMPPHPSVRVRPGLSVSVHPMPRWNRSRDPYRKTLLYGAFRLPVPRESYMLGIMRRTRGARSVLLACYLASILWIAAGEHRSPRAQAVPAPTPEKTLPAPGKPTPAPETPAPTPEKTLPAPGKPTPAPETPAPTPAKAPASPALPDADLARHPPALPETSATLALPNRSESPTPTPARPEPLAPSPGGEKPAEGPLVPGYSPPGLELLDSRRNFFRIGYLTPVNESPMGRPWFQDLKQALEKDAAVSRAMANAGISGVALRPCDHPEDMLQRMLQAEFDLVFCPALVYVRERMAESSHYRVVFRTLRPGRDFGDSRTGEQIRQRGVLFVRKGCSLGRALSTPRGEEVKRLLRSTPLAVSGSYDAAGCFYIRKMLWEEYDHCEPGEFLYCGSPQEVVKAVVSGLCDAGACEESVLQEVLATVPAGVDGMRDLVTVLKTTKPVLTDPIVIQESYDPVSRNSELGQAVRDALRRFYQERGKTEPAAPRLEQGSDKDYDRMEEDVRLTRTIYRW